MPRPRGNVFRTADAPSAPVVLVLGAGLNADGTPSPYLAARLDVAATLVGSGRPRAVLGPASRVCATPSPLRDGGPGGVAVRGPGAPRFRTVSGVEPAECTAFGEGWPLT